MRTFDDVMAIKSIFLASMGYHIFLIMELRLKKYIAGNIQCNMARNLHVSIGSSLYLFVV